MINICVHLDGGGIRSLSSLLILEKVMRQIRELQIRDGLGGDEALDTLPLPCHFFDYMIGTSAGG